VLGVGEPLVGRLALIDALAGRVRDVAVSVDPACPLHGSHATLLDVTDDPDVPVAAPRGVAPLPAEALNAFLETHPAARVLDVREPHELALGPAPKSIHLPASRLDARLHELDTALEYVVACRVGAKSRWAAGRLYDAGFRRLHHLDGGLLAYAVTQPDFEFF
ncbi:MAG: hypothetical protein IAI49_10345, partial [Candidatus Eremiobacteraeota bacterium]|nr:hypothetical protein [Candidatus Eremiobacteraeota bacterium]